MARLSRRALAVLLLAATASGCTGSSAPAATASRSPAAGPTAAAAPTVWLCRPGMARNPCEGNLDATVVTRTGRSVERFVPARDPKIDCFYVYPTVSGAKTANAPRASAPEIVSTARAQAARFAATCRLFVPVYRQLTLNALLTGTYFDPKAQALAAADVRDAWRDYLAHDNHGRGVVLIGHSQGAMALTRLIREDIEPHPAVRRLLVSALLLGGRVTTAAGADAGGDFATIPACRRAAETGCVVAWSSFASRPPANAFFGVAPAGRDALCTDPGTLDRDGPRLHPYLPSDRVPGKKPPTPFVAYPGSITGTCRHSGAATWLQVTRVPGSAIPTPTQQLGSQWGLHTGDISLALGDLVDIVRLQAAAWR